MAVHRTDPDQYGGAELLLTTGTGEAKPSRSEEAALIAWRIAALMQSPMQVEEKEGSRPLRCGDVAILFRSMTHVQEYAAALAHLRIPHYVVSGRGLFDQQEVHDLINLLQSVVNPRDRAALFGALRGPAFGLRDDTLFLLSEGAGRNLASGLDQAGELLPEGPERERAVRAAGLLSGLRRAIRREPAERALELVLDQTAFLRALAAAPGGGQAVANIRKIQGWLREESAGGGAGDLTALVRWLELNRENEVREGLAALAAEQDPTTVKLLTVHKAKGLEWPVVILADASGRARSDTDAIRYRPGWGVALRPRSAMGESPASLVWERMKEAEKAAAEAEGRRLFYVAATRARDLLVVSGRPAAATSETWLRHLAFWYEQDETQEGHGLAVRLLTDGDLPEGGALEAAVSDAMLPDGPEPLRELLRRTGPAGGWGETEPVPTSSSRLMDLAACPRRYYLKYVLGMPEPRWGGDEEPAAAAPVLPNAEEEWVEPTLRGLVLHWICERLREPNEVDGLIRQALHQFGLAGTPKAAPLAAAARAMLDRYMASPLFARMQGGRVEAEVPFSVAAAGLLLEGRIDALGVDDAGQPLLVDFKTNRVSATEVPLAAESYRLQMSVYALAAHELGYPVGSALLYFLEPGLVCEIPFNREELLDQIAGLSHRLRRSETDIGGYPQELGHCAHCRYRPICGT